MFDELAVAEELQELIEAVNNVEAVYIGIPEYPSVFPSVSISPSGWEETWADLRDTTDNHVFTIRVYIQLGIDKLDSQQQLWAIVKDIRSELGDHDNMTLGGLVDSSRLTLGQYIFDQKESKLYYCELTYNCRKRFDRYSV